MRSLAFLALAFVSPLGAQRVLSLQTGPAANQLGQLVRPAGDLDADGVPDFVATERQPNGPSRVQAVSGATGRELLSILNGIDPTHQSSLLDAVGIGDATGDGRSDVAVVIETALWLVSGANGQVLRSLWPPSAAVQFTSVCEAGDVDGDGRADVALASFVNTNNHLVQLISGANGLVLSTLATLPGSPLDTQLRPAGDLDGDGRMDFALRIGSGQIAVVHSASSAARTVRPLPAGDMGQQLATVDLDGDGKRELIVGRPQLTVASGGRGQVDVYAGSDGHLQLTIAAAAGAVRSFGRAVAAAGDLDRDGMQDLAIGWSIGTGSTGYVEACSGRTGGRIWSFAGHAPLLDCGLALAAVGDVDRDGYADLAIGCGGTLAGWTLLSARVLADVVDVGGACGGGPFLPQLGMTRPLLGLPFLVSGRDGAPGTLAVLALSLQPPVPTYLGAANCTAWFDLGNWLPLYSPQQPTWSIQVPLPNTPQLAGLPVALQCLYAPTRGPLGFDLSNGVWARVGF